MIKVFVNGTFDILHVGHIQMLNFAKSQGHYLTVGIDCDIRVKKLKGSSRPINSEIERKFLLENLKSVDNVIIFKDDCELIDLIKNHDIMVKGSDYINQTIIGESVCKKLIFFDLVNGYSTSKKIQDIISR